MEKEDYVSFGVAKLLRKKNCEINSLFYYDENGKSFVLDEERTLEAFYNMSKAIPKISLYEAAKWLRKEHHIFITVTPEFSKSYEMIEYRVRITTYWDAVERKKGHLLPLWFERYEDALDTGIEEALKKL